MEKQEELKLQRFDLNLMWRPAFGRSICSDIMFIWRVRRMGQFHRSVSVECITVPPKSNSYQRCWHPSHLRLQPLLFPSPLLVVCLCPSISFLKAGRWKTKVLNWVLYRNRDAGLHHIFRKFSSPSTSHGAEVFPYKSSNLLEILHK